jgi:hypothetical protein
MTKTLTTKTLVVLALGVWAGSLLWSGDASAAIPVAAARPAPAPLLAAGLPAFAALGGGFAWSRLIRPFVRRRRSGASRAPADTQI